MKVEIKKIDETKRELSIEIPPEHVHQKLDEVYQELSKTAKIKGFRQGKVPRLVLEGTHGKLAREETIKKIIPEAYQEAIKEKQLVPLELPEIYNVSFKDGVISFQARFDIKPEVHIKEYKKIPVKKKDTQITKEELQQTLELFLKGQGKNQPAVMDDQTARGLGYPSLAALKEALDRQLALEKDRQSRGDVEKQIVDHLLLKAQLTVPRSLIKSQVERYLSRMREHMKSHGHSEEEMKKKEAELLPEFQKTAEREIKVYLIMDKIVELEQIPVEENESMTAKVMTFLLKEAQWEN